MSGGAVVDQVLERARDAAATRHDQRERGCVLVCVCVCVTESERVCVRERE